LTQSINTQVCGNFTSWYKGYLPAVLDVTYPPSPSDPVQNASDGVPPPNPRIIESSIAVISYRVIAVLVALLVLVTVAPSIVTTRLPSAAHHRTSKDVEDVEMRDKSVAEQGGSDIF
jgi:hypothetical protein